MSDEQIAKPYAVLGLGHGDTPDEFLVLVHESERGGIPFSWCIRDIPEHVEQFRKAGKKDYEIARMMGYMAKGDCKFGFYLGMVDEDIYFYLNASICFDFLQEYGPGSTNEHLVKDKKVKFLVCDEVNF